MNDSIRNIYREDIDFSLLALQSPEFAKYLKPNNQLDFSDPAAVRQLSKSLLKRDFGLEVDLPEDRLCPPVPNRLNYILWLQDLIDTTGDKYSDTYDPDRDVVGLDIGTGCCSIYPLLGCSLRPRWGFVATDIDDENVKSSKRNVTLNKLDSRIRIVKTDATDGLIPLNDKTGVERLDFTMCNPPFYSSRDEIIASAETKERPPFSACTGAEIEMVTPGGEIYFVTRMIQESLHLGTRVVWYTTMLGKLSSVSVVIEELLKHGNRNYAVTEFTQGPKTRRWAVAWSWGDMRPALNTSRSIHNLPKHLLPFPSETSWDLPNSSSLDKVSETLDAELNSLPLHWTWRKDLARGTGFAADNVWSRQARRKMKAVAVAAKEAGGETGGEGSAAAERMEVEADQSRAVLGFAVQLRLVGREGEGVRVVVRWLKGVDGVMFESFCGMLKRKLEGR